MRRLGGGELRVWRWRCLALIASLAAFAPLGPGRASTLIDALKIAYAHNPTLEAQRATLRATDESYLEARGQFGPPISIDASGEHQDARVDETGLFGGPTPNHHRPDSYTADLSVTQPLYTSGRLSAGVNSAKAQILAARAELRQTEGQVLLAVVNAYASTFESQALLKNAQHNVSLLQAQYDEVKERVRVKQSTKTDMAQAEGRLAAAEANVIVAEGRLQGARDQYEAAVGEPPGEVEPPPPLPGLPDSLEAALDLTQRNNPILQAARYGEVASHEKIAQARAAGRPSVSLRLDLQRSPIEPYTPDLAQRSASATVTYSQPLYTSGVIASQVRGAIEQNTHDRIEIDVASRQSIQTLSQAWRQLSATRRALEVFNTQRTALKEAFTGMQKESRFGLRTTIDVLNAEQELDALENSIIQSEYEAYTATATIISQAGLLELRFLAADGPLYDPAAHLRKRQQAFSPPWLGLVKRVDGIAP